jgi:hypothetical protein
MRIPFVSQNWFCFAHFGIDNFKLKLPAILHPAAAVADDVIAAQVPCDFP